MVDLSDVISYGNRVIKIVPSKIEGRLAEQFSVKKGSEEFQSVQRGFEDAERCSKRNLWAIRNQGYFLRDTRDWSMEETEAWIKRHQGFYERGYGFQQSESGRDFLSKEHVEVAK
ncbi:MAG: hypothetical protein KKE50_04080 [Nanoarchaeota archaeon]|nr:hypothetical protein [Nanoarchaeota archaeon]